MFAPLIEGHQHNGAVDLEGGQVKGLGVEQRKEEEEQNFARYQTTYQKRDTLWIG